MVKDGGYDDGYRSCDCFWGRDPGSLISRLPLYRPVLSGLRVLDAGCGEGKNAIALARKGAIVEAVDCSELAIANAQAAWPDAELVQWHVRDVIDQEFGLGDYDVVVLYGLLHCLPSHAAISAFVTRCQQATSATGIHVLVSFNSRRQELTAHPGFEPTLLAHSDYLDLYGNWSILEASDSDLEEVHPHNGIPHVHSMTRIVAEKV